MSTPDPKLQQIIARAQQGDPDAIATLYQTFADAIYRYVAYRVTDLADAEDITADVFVRMVQGLPAYRITGAPFEAWLYRIAAARVIDFRRQTSRRPQVELSEELSADDPSPEARVQRNQEFETLREALQQLPDDQQTLLILRFVERKSHEDVAAILGKSVSAVKSMQHRALARLATLLGVPHKMRHYLRGQDT